MMKQSMKQIYFLFSIFMFSQINAGFPNGFYFFGKHQQSSTAQSAVDSPTTCSAISVDNGGTGACSLDAHYLLVGDGTSPVTLLAPSATIGTPLVSQGINADPAYSTTPSVTSISIANLPVAITDGANKAYVDFLASGIVVQPACVAATTADLGSVSYSNGAAGVGATLTNTGALVQFSIDDQSPTVGQAVLIKDQTLTYQNGIYIVTTVGSGAVAWVLTRATYYDSPSEIVPGTLVPVTAGTVNTSTLWLETATVAAIGVGNPILFSQFFKQGIVTLVADSGTAAGTNVAIAGGNNISTSASSTTLTVNVSGTTEHAVQVGNATNSLTSLSLGTDGQVLLGATAADPSWVTPTAGTGLLITTNPTTLSYSLATPVPVTSGGTGLTTLTAHGVLIGEDTSNLAVTGVGALGVPLIGQGVSSDPIFGTAAVVGGGTGAEAFTAHGVLIGEGSSTFGVTEAGTLGIPLIGQGASSDPIFGTARVSGGGTGATTLTAHGVLIGEGTSTIGVTATGTSGIPLIGQGASSDPIFGTAGVTGGGTGLTTLTAHGVLIGEGTSNLAVTGVGALGIPLIGQGASSDPIFGTARVSGGGTGATTLTAHGVLLGEGTSTIGVTATGTSGIPLIGQGASSDPIFGTAAVVGGGTGLTTLTAYNLLTGNGTSAVTLISPISTAGIPLVSQGISANPAYSTAAVAGGGTGLTSLAAYDLLVGNGVSAVSLIAPASTIGIPLVSQGPSANPTYSTAVVAGGGTGATTFTAHGVLLGEGTSNLAVTGVGALGIPLIGQGASSDPIFGTAAVTGGGTGATTLTAHGVLLGEGTSPIGVTGTAASGIPLIGQGASSDPIFGTAAVTGGGTGLTTLTAYNLLTGNGASAVTLISPISTAGIPLVSQGISANPSYSTAAVAGGGTGLTTLTAHGVLVGEGTSTIQSVTGTTGTVLIGTVGLDPSFSATPSVTSISIANLPVANTDGVNKEYVDLLAAGIVIQAACVAATTADLGSVTYNNGASGVGATLTNTGTFTAFSIDGQSPTVGQRVLIKDQTTTFQNGIYTVTTVGSGAVAWVLTRATDFDSPSDISPGDLVPVTAGTVNASTLWLETATVTTVGVDPILFSQFFQPPSITLTGNAGSATGSNITVAGGNNILTSGASTTLTVNVSGTTAHAVQIGNVTGSLSSVTPSATSGIPLIGQGSSSDPIFGTAAVTGGGTGATTLTAHGVLLGEGTSAIGVTGTGASGIPLIGQGASSDPIFGTAAVTGGGTGLTTLTQYDILVGNGASAA
jgi:hypothetical protein